MWPFKSAPLLDADTAEWHVTNVHWLLRHFGRSPAITHGRILRPGLRLFDCRDLQGFDLAQHLFKQMKDLSGLTTPWLELVNSNIPGDDYTIYPDRAENEPFALIAHFARTLGWALIGSTDAQPPSSEEERLALAELAACFMGYGVFLANDAIQVRTIVEGSKTHVGHYHTEINSAVTESELLFDLALYILIHKANFVEAERFLEFSLRPHFKTALRDAAPRQTQLRDALSGY